MRTAVSAKPTAIVAVSRAGTLDRADLRNLGLLMFGFACVVLLVPPVRAYPMNDDWAYSRTVTSLLNWAYRPHESSMTVAFSHNVWGALFAALFGQSFTVLSIANLVMSAACVVLFYLLLRHLNVNSPAALFGAALLALNPIYFRLSYSFMTDVTFLTFTLAACLFYIRGLDGHGEGWLWLGSAGAALACLDRQFGIAIVLGVLCYLWLSRRWSWRSAIAVALLPLAAMILYMLWERSYGTRLVDLDIERVRTLTAQYPIDYLVERGNRLCLAVSMIGLSLLPLIRRPRKLIIALFIFLPLAVFLIWSARANGGLFPPNGDIVDVTGFVMGYYDAAIVWTPAVWTLLGVAGAFLISLYLAACLEQAWEWLRSRPWEARVEDPALLLYLTSALMMLLFLALSPFLFDRYFLLVIAALMLPALRRISGSNVGEDGGNETGNNPTALWRWALLIPLALFALVGQRDYMEHAAVRWQAAESLAAQGVPRNKIDAGFEWAGWYLYDEGAQRIRQTGDLTYIYFPAYAALDPVYVFSDRPRDGYLQVGSFPYTSWLDGGQTRYVLLLKRKG